jgi:hypothetical protein
MLEKIREQKRMLNTKNIKREAPCEKNKKELKR